jgi:hypothetical protein
LYIHHLEAKIAHLQKNIFLVDLDIKTISQQNEAVAVFLQRRPIHLSSSLDAPVLQNAITDHSLSCINDSKNTAMNSACAFGLAVAVVEHAENFVLSLSRTNQTCFVQEDIHLSSVPTDKHRQHAESLTATWYVRTGRPLSYSALTMDQATVATLKALH